MIYVIQKEGSWLPTVLLLKFHCAHCVAHTRPFLQYVLNFRQENTRILGPKIVRATAAREKLLVRVEEKEHPP